MYKDYDEFEENYALAEKNYSWEVIFNLSNNKKETVKTITKDNNTKSVSDFVFKYFSEEDKQFKNMINYMNKWNELIEEER